MPAPPRLARLRFRENNVALRFCLYNVLGQKVQARL
jgi:hypothetical protein